jgi:hypothetical protein
MYDLNICVTQSDWSETLIPDASLAARSRRVPVVVDIVALVSDLRFCTHVCLAVCSRMGG